MLHSEDFEGAYHDIRKMEYPLLSTGCHSRQHVACKIKKYSDELEVIFSKIGPQIMR